MQRDLDWGGETDRHRGGSSGRERGSVTCPSPMLLFRRRNFRVFLSGPTKNNSVRTVDFVFRQVVIHELGLLREGSGEERYLKYLYHNLRKTIGIIVLTAKTAV